MARPALPPAPELLPMKILLPSLLCMLLPLSAAAQTRPAQAPTAASPIAQPSLYAVNSAALASAMTYCSVKYGGLTRESPGEACFSRARGVLAGFGLKERSHQIDAACPDPATFNTCLTPHIGRLVYALNDAFAERGL